MRVLRRDVFVAAPGEGRGYAMAFSHYTRPTGVEKIAYRLIMTRSDTADSWERAFSVDNGRAWSSWEVVDTMFPTARGVRRVRFFPGAIDRETGWLLDVAMEGELPTDDPLEGMKQWFLRYRISTDGGRTHRVDRRMVQRGDYTPKHPFEGFWIGRNSMMLGDVASVPLPASDGRILVPVTLTPTGPDGQYHNPGGGYTYHESTVVIGTRRAEGYEWEISRRVVADPARSTRGADEPTVAEFPDGRILMAIRGSNDVRPELPGYRWRAVSTDGGYTWGPLEPWTYDDGLAFHSPASCSQLLRHSSGRTYWIGNICPENPRGNHPRHPLVIGEVDPDSLLLRRTSVTEIDTRREGEDPKLAMSNFVAHEDRETGEILVHVGRFSPSTWRSDAYVYRLET